MSNNSDKKKISKPKKLIHFRDKCIGCGMCVVMSPKYWEMSEKDGLANLKNAKKVKDTDQKEIDFGDEQESQDASNNCPVNIIQVS